MVEYCTLLLLEFLNKDAVKTALDKAGKSDFYDKILDLDPTKDKNAVFSVKLTKFFLEPRSQSDDRFFDALKYYFHKFMVLKKYKVLKGTDGDLNSYKKFDDFHNTLDKIEAEIKKSKPADVVAKMGLEPDGGKASSEKPIDAAPIGGVARENQIDAFGHKIDKNDVTYQDENIIVIRADNPSKSKKYGCGFSTWCTARKTGNLFYTYRFAEDPETMYYVYMLKKDPKDPEQVLHFGVTESGEISYTDKRNAESDQTLNWLAQKFPEIAPAIKANAFEFVPITDTERQVQGLPDEISSAQFNMLDYQTREMWLLSGDRIVKFDVWNLMDDNFKNLYIRSLSDNEHDLDPAVKQAIKGSRFEPLYKESIRERLTDKLGERDQGDNEYLTQDEVQEIIDSKMYDVMPYMNGSEFTAMANLGGDKLLRRDIILGILTKKEYTTYNPQLVIPWVDDKQAYVKELLAKRSVKEVELMIYFHLVPDPAELVDFVVKTRPDLITYTTAATLLKYSRDPLEMFDVVLKRVSENGLMMYLPGIVKYIPEQYHAAIFQKLLNSSLPINDKFIETATVNFKIPKTKEFWDTLMMSKNPVTVPVYKAIILDQPPEEQKRKTEIMLRQKPNLAPDVLIEMAAHLDEKTATEVIIPKLKTNGRTVNVIHQLDLLSKFPNTYAIIDMVAQAEQSPTGDTTLPIWKIFEVLGKKPNAKELMTYAAKKLLESLRPFTENDLAPFWKSLPPQYVIDKLFQRQNQWEIGNAYITEKMLMVSPNIDDTINKFLSLTIPLNSDTYRQMIRKSPNPIAVFKKILDLPQIKDHDIEINDVMRRIDDPATRDQLIDYILAHPKSLGRYGKEYILQFSSKPQEHKKKIEDKEMATAWSTHAMPTLKESSITYRDFFL